MLTLSWILRFIFKMLLILLSVQIIDFFVMFFKNWYHKNTRTIISIYYVKTFFGLKKILGTEEVFTCVCKTSSISREANRIFLRRNRICMCLLCILLVTASSYWTLTQCDFSSFWKGWKLRKHEKKLKNEYQKKNRTIIKMFFFLSLFFQNRYQKKPGQLLKWDNYLYNC